MLWIILDPMTQVITMTAMWLLAGRLEVNGVNVALFIAIGTAPYTVAHLSLTSIPKALAANRLFYNYQQVKPIDSFIAEFILEISLMLIGEVLIFAILWWFFGLTFDLGAILPLLSLFGLAMVLGFGLGLMAATYGTRFDTVKKLLSFTSRPLMILSAVFYTLNDLPPPARYFLSWNPLVHIIEYARYYAFGLKLFPEASLTYAVMFALVALFLGFVCYYPNRLRLIEQ